MREVITIQVGQCGNQIGAQYWNLLLLEHEKTPDYDPALSSFFYFDHGKNTNTKAMKARALLIDMECGPLQETMRSSLGSLFDEHQFVMDVSGSGNNFAQGYAMYGPMYREKFEEGLRKNAERCDSLQSFLVMHSLGGGTGSGVGSYVIGLLHDLYPNTFRFSAPVYPSQDNDVVTSPYNTMLATRELIEHADCVFPMDNASLFSFSKLELPKEDPNQSPIIPASKSKSRGFDSINGIAARMLCHLTSSSRFNGEMNVDMNEIYTNLVPFPHLHFMMTALSVRTPSTGHAKSAIGTLSKESNYRISLQRAFGDVLSNRGQLTTAFLTPSSPTITLASAFLARGKVPFSDFLTCVTNAQKTSLRFPSWNANACKIGMCGTASPGEDLSVLAVYNSTSFGSVLRREMEGFQKLYRKKAMLHHYTEFIEDGLVKEAESYARSLIQDYEDIENNCYSGGGMNRTLANKKKGQKSKSNMKSDATINQTTSNSQPTNVARVQLFPAF